MNDFLELLFSNDEFEFKYNGATYEIVSINGRSIFTKDNILVASYFTNEDLLMNGELQSVKIRDIIDKLICN